MPHYRVLLDIKVHDLLVEAKDEKEAHKMVFEAYRNFRPFGGALRLLATRVREPWKFQIKNLKEKA